MQDADLAISVTEFISKSALDADSDGSECVDSPALAEFLARLHRATANAKSLLHKQASAIIFASDA